MIDLLNLKNKKIMMSISINNNNNRDQLLLIPLVLESKFMKERINFNSNLKKIIITPPIKLHLKIDLEHIHKSHKIDRI